MTNDRMKELEALLDAPATLIPHANELIALKVQAAKDIIAEAEAIAEKFKIAFEFDLAYGMGGTYKPKPDNWSSSDYYDIGWVSSSSNC